MPSFSRCPYDNDVRSFSTFKLTNGLFFNIDANDLFPIIVREEIDKKFEIRCVVFGNSIVSAKIYVDIPYYEDINFIDYKLKEVTEIELDDATKMQIFNLMSLIGLEIACIDFIVDKENKMYFLEINESGQFLYLKNHCKEITTLDTAVKFFAKKINVKSDIVFKNMQFSYNKYRS